MTKGPRLIPEYNYQNLPSEGLHIRLLKLEPGEREDYIHCHLEPVNLAEARGTYECISYVWGNTTELRRIIVDGHSFYVTISLFQALQHFRLKDRERTLWADAICIQQQSPPEKGRQVQMMGKIYENSLGTLVWLGMDTDRIAVQTVDFLKETSQISRQLVDKYGSVTKIPTLSEAENPISQDPEKWKLFSSFVNYRWFTRTWGDAEIKLSDVINVNELQRHAPHLFGVLSLSFFLHDAFLGVFMTYENPDSWREHVVQDFIEQAKVLVPRQTCIDTLNQSSRRNCTDARDHIFSLLAHPLLYLNGEIIMQADYERDVDDVYLEVTSKVLQHVDPTLTLTTVGGMGTRKERDLEGDQPSWVIRWDLGKTYSLAIGRLEQWFHAGGKGATADIKIDTTAKSLTVPAAIFDTVLYSSEQLPASDLRIDDVVSGPEHRVAIDWVWDALPDFPCRYTGKFGSRDAYTLSLVCGSYKHRYPAEDDINQHRRLANAYRDYVKSFFGGGGGNDGLRSDARDFENDFARLGLERRFIVTEKGFYGLGPQLLQRGDVVAIIPGIRVPMALRPAGKHYRLVGAAYVHGVMRGEVLDKEDPLNLGVGAPGEIIIV